MELKIGNIDKYIVKKETDISYTLNPLNNNDIEIFLHFNQALKPLKVGEKIDAFLYYDNQKRLCATTEVPLATTTKYGFAEVVDIKFEAGCFMNIGIAKDILLSKDYLPSSTGAWPKVGDKLPIILKIKKNALTCKIITRTDIKEKSILKVGDATTAVVCSFTSTGLICISYDYDYIYIHRSLTRAKFHLGEVINPHITNITEQGILDGSLIEQKEKMMDNDAKTILKYLNDFGGTLMLGNASTPEEISKVFPMSKSAFKRAVGSLYKQHLITIEDYKITLNK